MKTILDVEELVFSPPELGGVLSLPGPSGGGSKIHDRSPYGDVGTITGATWIRLPGGLFCPGFDGVDDKVTCPHISPFAWGTATDYTFLAWINTTANMSYGVVIDKSQNTPRIYNRLRVRSNALGGVVDAYVQVGATETNPVGTARVNDGIWHLIGFSHRRGVTSGAVIYVDGKIDGQANGISVDMTNTQKLGIGQSDSQVDNAWFNGKIALPRVYNYIPSALEIQNHFDREKHLFGVW